jgi:hypothetical protein
VRIGKDSDRRDYENQRENNPAETINSFRLFIPMLTFEYGRDQNFNKGEEDEQRAHQNKSIQAGGVG